MHTDWPRLAAFLGLWKCLLLVVATLSPGPGYDTSTQILFRPYPDAAKSWSFTIAQNLAAKLTRWDAIYFAASSERGYLFEQEWAFSRTYAAITSTIARAFPSSLCPSAIVRHALAGVLLSSVSHVLSVFTLYQLTYELLPLGREKKRRVAFTAACLHVITPAGLFLSAPNAESTFALANFGGMLCYTMAFKHGAAGHPDVLATAMWTIATGITFGFASMVRSNGLLSGMILAWDALVSLPKIPIILQRRWWNWMVPIVSTLTAGSIVAIAYALPQALAYSEYCMNEHTRPWCARLIPSIYTWVQDHYWGVGLFRYWTLSNLPLFLLATPMVSILVVTATAAMLRTPLITLIQDFVDGRPMNERKPGPTSTFTHVLARLALPQLVLAVLTATTFHVQIVNRISSGYPVWYIVLAIAVHAEPSRSIRGKMMEQGPIVGRLCRNVQMAVRASVMYAIIQGGLYASFLPPA